MQILVVDDSAAVRSRLAELLIEQSGVVRVEQAADASEGLNKARSLRPDVIVLDLHLPDRNGLTLLPELRLMQPRPYTIVLTNDATEQYRRQCRELGADYFFDKSTEFWLVVSFVAELARRR